MKKIFIAVISIVLIINFVTLSDAQEENNLWQSQILSGISYFRGNTDKLLYNSSATTERTENNNKLKFGFNYSYGEENKEKDNETIKLYQEFEQELYSQIYWYGDSSFKKDYVSELDRELNLMPGLGIYIFPGEKELLSFDVGPVYTIEKYNNCPLRDNIIYRLRQRAQVDVTDYFTVTQSINYFSKFDDKEKYQIDAKLGAKVKMITNITLHFDLQSLYNNRPQTNKKHNDFSAIIGVGYEF